MSVDLESILLVFVGMLIGWNLKAIARVLNGDEK